ncbi:MAG: ribokinase [Bacteroidota bacterium]
MKRPKIIVIGSCNTDMIVKANRLPVPGETVLGGSFMMSPGGKGANQSIAAERLGGDVTFITKTGNDLFARQSIELYESEGINTSYVFSDLNNPSGVALISVDGYGENCIIVASGANQTLSSKDIEKARNEIINADIVLMQLEVPINTIEYAAKLASGHHIKVILNPAPAAALNDEIMKSLFLIVPNRVEAEILSGIKVNNFETAKKAAKIISQKGVDNVIITLGKNGAFLKDGKDCHAIAAPIVEAIDTTGAGDTFCGALSVAISEGKSLFDAVVFANTAASITVTRMGAQAAIPYRKEVKIDFPQTKE